MTETCACGTIISDPYPDGVVMCFECRHTPLVERAARILNTFQARADVSVQSEVQGSKIRFTAWLNGRVVGSMLVTHVPLVHDMEIDDGTLQRKIADALFQYASGYVRASGFTEALVLVKDTNERMQRYVGARALPEEPSKAYLYEVK